MSDRTKIEWTDATWNPIVGCSPVSPGCANCYAARLASTRLAHLPRYAGLAKNGRWLGETRFDADEIDKPLRWRKPRRVFVCSMGDLFHDGVHSGHIMDVWWRMAHAGHHYYCILTKRTQRLHDWLLRWSDVHEDCDPQMARGPEAVRGCHRTGRAELFAAMLETWGEPPDGCAYPSYDWMEGPRWWPTALWNAWLGTSAENQRWADERIPWLLRTPAAKRFVSLEPLLGPVELDLVGLSRSVSWLEQLDWVIAGAETGPGARPAELDWFRSLRDQCVEGGVPFFLKKVNARGDRELDGRLWEDVPE